MLADTVKQRKILFWTLVVAVIAFFAFTYIASPWMSDDYWYKGDLRQFGKMADGSYSLWHGIKETIVYRYYMDNARLANVLSALTIWMPHWILATLVSGAFALIVLLMLRLANITSRNIGALTVVMALMIVSWPWYENMYCIVFAYNYILSTLLLLATTTAFLENSNRNWCLLFVLGVLLGAWHEAFAVSFIGGGVAMLIFRYFQPTKGRIALLCGVAVGLIYLIVADSAALRVNANVNGISLDVAKVQPFNVLFLAVWLGMMCFGKTRKIARQPLPVFAIVVVVGMLLLQMIVRHGRSAFPGYVMSTICYGYFIVKLSPDKMRVVQAVLAGLVWTFLLVHLSVVAVYTVKIASEWQQALAVYNSDDCVDGVVYIDYTTEANSTPLLLRKQVFYHFGYRVDTNFLSRVLDKDAEMVVVPSCLNSYDGSGINLDGNCDAKLYKNCVVLKRNFESIPLLAIIDVGMGKSLRVVEAHSFVGIDGVPYMYLYFPLHYWEHFINFSPRYVDLF